MSGISRQELEAVEVGALVRVTFRTGRQWVGAFGAAYPAAAWARLFVREDGTEVALQPREVASVVSAACDGCACGIRHACDVVVSS